MIDYVTLIVLFAILYFPFWRMYRKDPENKYFTKGMFISLTKKWSKQATVTGGNV